MAFWVSVAVLAIVFFIDGRLDPILVSIALGLLVVGIWLKIQYRTHLRRDPKGP